MQLCFVLFVDFWFAFEFLSFCNRTYICFLPIKRLILNNCLALALQWDTFVIMHAFATFCRRQCR